MRSAKRKAITLAVICVAAGLLISFVALATLDFNFFEMSTMEPRTNTYTLAEGFSNIKVWGAECDVRLLPSGDGACTVLCNETDRITHTVTVKNGTLTIERTDNRKWFEHIGFTWNYWGPIEVTVYLPERAYKDLDIRTVSGDVEIPDGFSFSRAEVDGTSGDVSFTAEVEGDLFLKTVSGGIRVGRTAPETLTVESTSGKVIVDSAEVRTAFSCKTISGTQEISNLTCQNATVYSTSGSVLASDLIASDSIRMENVSGSLKLSRCDADALWLKTVSGDVTGILCTDKVFVTHTTSGSIHVPDAVSGGTCEVKTVSGSIDFDLLDQ